MVDRLVWGQDYVSSILTSLTNLIFEVTMKAYGIRRKDMGCSWGCCPGRFGRLTKNITDNRKQAKQRKIYKRLAHKAERARIKQIIWRLL